MPKTKPAPATAKDLVFAVELDAAELVLRMIEAVTCKVRPEGVTAAEALADFPDDVLDDFHRAAQSVADYLKERIEAAALVQ